MSTHSPSGGAGKASSGFRGPLVALAVVGLLVAGLLVGRFYFGPEQQVTPAAGTGTSVPLGGPFTLVDQDGQTVTDQDFRGRWLLIYFGFTYCPDVCPTSLNRNVQALDILPAEKAEKVTPILITVDPERDTAPELKPYVAAFHPRMVGLTGTPEQIAAVAKAYRVYYAKAGKDPDNYLVDHSSFTYLVGPDGRFVQLFRHAATPEEVADGLSRLL